MRRVAEGDLLFKLLAAAESSEVSEDSSSVDMAKTPSLGTRW